MREIKFKFWEPVNKIMSLWGEFDYTFIVETPVHGAIMQYIGLKDINGKEIYEGDIMKAEDGTWEVQWRDAANFALINDAKQEGSVAFADGTYALEETEIIGNIYENPELLK